MSCLNFNDCTIVQLYLGIYTHKKNKVLYYKIVIFFVFYQSGDPTGLYDLIVSPDVTVLQGCGLGGTSLINANVALECEPKIFEDEVRIDKQTNK